MGLERYLPHSAEMILLDELLSVDENHIKTSLCIRADNAFLNEKKQFELLNALELMAQSVGVWRGLSDEKEGQKLGFLLSSRAFEIFKEAVEIGTKLEISAIMSMQDESGFGVYECEVYECKEAKKLLARANISVLNPSKEMLEKLQKDEI